MPTLPPRICTKVCFIAGAGHSGSTLLGFILGSHSQGFYCGEAAKTRFLQDDRKALSKRVCKICGVECPVWGSFRPRQTIDLYEQVAARVQKPLVVDSSKHVAWIQAQVEQLQPTTTQPYLVFLQRDGRAVINSRIRKYPQKEVGELISSWVEQIQLTQQLFHAFPGQKIKLRYEQLAAQPATAVHSLCQFLGIDYQPEMLSYAQHEHHVLGGNNGTQFLVARSQQLAQPFVQLLAHNRCYYEHHGAQIALDLRWQQELDPAIVRLFDKIAGQENQELRWDG